MKNPAAVSLGRMARGVKKNISKAESARRKLRLQEARKKRWPEKPFKQGNFISFLDRDGKPHRIWIVAPVDHFSDYVKQLQGLHGFTEFTLGVER